MDVLTLILILTVLINIVLVIWLFLFVKKQQTEEPLTKSLLELKSELISKQMEGLLSLRESLDTANQTLHDRLSEGNKTLDQRMTVINEIENKLGKLSTQTANLETIGKNIQSLSDILKPPKMRGQFGEILLENLLKEILPAPLLEFQYQFKDGGRVDAAVRLNNLLLPIDSKFPLESFHRLLEADSGTIEFKKAEKEFGQALKKHIDVISDKYIRPDEQTTDFAIIYLPSEALYNQLLSVEQEELFRYSLSRKIIPSSPGHLYGFLASVSAVYTEAGLTADSRKLGELLQSLQTTVSKLNDFNDRVGGSLRSALKTVDKTKEQLNSAHLLLDQFLEPERDEVSEN